MDEALLWQQIPYAPTIYTIVLFMHEFISIGYAMPNHMPMESKCYQNHRVELDLNVELWTGVQQFTRNYYFADQIF